MGTPNTGTCRECGATYQAQRPSREFCCTAHRQAFHNRKMLDGKKLVDLAIAWRFDRAAFKGSGGLTALCRMISKIKADNDRDRRRSIRIWDNAAAVKSRNPHLAAAIVAVNVAGVQHRGMAHK